MTRPLCKNRYSTGFRIRPAQRRPGSDYFAVGAIVAIIALAPVAAIVGIGPSAALDLSTNSVVKVLERSICLPFTLSLNWESTANTVGGPSLGMTPSGVKIPKFPFKAAR